MPGEGGRGEELQCQQTGWKRFGWACRREFSMKITRPSFPPPALFAPCSSSASITKSFHLVLYQSLTPVYFNSICFFSFFLLSDVLSCHHINAFKYIDPTTQIQLKKKAPPFLSFPGNTDDVPPIRFGKRNFVFFSSSAKFRSFLVIKVWRL